MGAAAAQRGGGDEYDVHSRVLVIEDWRGRSDQRAEVVDNAIETIKKDIASINRKFAWFGGVTSTIATLFAIVKLLFPLIERVIK